MIDYLLPLFAAAQALTITVLWWRLEAARAVAATLTEQRDEAVLRLAESRRTARLLRTQAEEVRGGR